MYNTITTQYFGPDAVRGSRVKAKAEGGHSIILPWESGAHYDRNHCAAAKALASKQGWTGLWIAGGMENGNSYVRLEGTFSPEWIDKFICGTEGVDWFHIAEADK